MSSVKYLVQNPKTRARPRRKPRSSRSAPRSGGMTSRPKTRRTSQSIAQSIVTRNMTSFRQDGAVSHRIFGKGYRFSGEQLLFNITTTASDSSLFGSGVASASSSNSIFLNMASLKGRLEVMGNLYARYRFTSLDFEFEPLCASTQTGGFCLAYSADPTGYVDTGLTYGDLTQSEPSVVAAFRSEKKVSLHVSYTGDECYFVANEEVTDAAVRQQSQGVLMGAPSSTSIGAVNQGILRLRYVVEFYSPTSTAGQTLNRLSHEEYSVLSEKLHQLRAQSHLDKGVKEPLSRDQSRCFSCSTSSCSSVSAPASTVLNERYILVTDPKRS